jgi:hypothetical protein
VHLLREDHRYLQRTRTGCEVVDAGDQIEAAGRGDRGARVEKVALHVDD